MIPFFYGFLTAGIIFLSLAIAYYCRALRRVRLMQRYMKDDAAKIVHAATKDIYGKKP